MRTKKISRNKPFMTYCHIQMNFKKLIPDNFVINGLYIIVVEGDVYGRA